MHLHLHTEYSMLDGASRVDDVVARAVADGQPAVGITDHGNMYGVLDCYAAARAAGIKPIIGDEAYFVTTSRRDRPRRAEHEIFHLTLLAETRRGYRNLIKLSSARVPRRLPLQAADRLRAARATPRGDHRDERLPRQRGVPGAARRTTRRGALESRARFQDILGRDNFFIELQDHGLPEQHRVEPGAARGSRATLELRCSRRTTATTRTVSDAEAHAALLCVQTGRTLDDPNRLQVRRRASST